MIAAVLYQLALSLRTNHLMYLDSMISKNHVIHPGYRIINGQTTKVIRVYGSNGKLLHQFSPSSKSGLAALESMKLSETLQQKKDSLQFKKQLEQSTSATHFGKDAQDCTRFSREYFDQLVELNDKDLPRNHEFDGHFFRSKSELITAQILKSLGLEYKYEVIVTVGTQTYYIDFAVFCPETGRMFFIEHFGMMADETYRFKTFSKMTNYMGHGFQEGLDIIYVYENCNDCFNSNILKGKILGTIAAQLLSRS